MSSDDGNLGDPDRLIDVFASEDEFPLAAVMLATVTWDDGFGERARAMLHGYVDGTDLSERTERALFIITHVMAEKADTASFPALCALALDPDRLASVMGDEGSVFSYGSILTSTFDGDPAPLYRLIEAPAADDCARADAFLVLGYLARTGRIPEREVYDYMAEVAARLEADEDGFVWFGYAQAVAALGFAGLSGIVEQAFGRGMIPSSILTSAHFWQDLREAQQDPKDLSAPVWIRFQPIHSAMQHLKDLTTTPDDNGAEPDYMPAEPIRNPLRNVGRNDPCPCGSGKKYKKCCLQAVP